MLADPALAAVLASGQLTCSATIRHASQLDACFSEILDGAREAGAISPTVSPDDLRRLLCGVQRAVQIGPHANERADAYLQILLRGLRTGAELDAV